eukprot:CAMPEP_0183734064 /NCGR_PEP_ID=MMETSP0737-20130205/42819_1 /TAXON_ID=385413 /ORGANISM="Thalassiosira miniscula, Strain CCMP1093" /LENGTH=142 /DNA_ID=CAMNT_0025967461 /DNA_START=26 /DNA_END=450 /DNA_ORIENTATION=-
MAPTKALRDSNNDGNGRNDKSVKNSKKRARAASRKRNKLKNSKNQHAQQPSRRPGRLVILRPSSNDHCSVSDSSNNKEVGAIDERHCRWPLYQNHCQNYGFAVDVEQYWMRQNFHSMKEGRNKKEAMLLSSDRKKDCEDEAG